MSWYRNRHCADRFTDTLSWCTWRACGLRKRGCRSGMSIHYNDVIMSAMTSQITSLMIVYSTVYSVTDQGKHQSSVSLEFVSGIHRWPMNSPHKGSVTRTMFPLDDVIMQTMHPDIVLDFTKVVQHTVWQNVNLKTLFHVEIRYGCTWHPRQLM